jgi:hypothetical protein
MGEILVAAVVLAMSALFFVTSLTFPQIGADPLGLARVPQFIALASAIASLAVIARAARRLRAEQGVPRPILGQSLSALRAAIADPWRPSILVVPLTFAYPAAVLAAGFLVGTTVYLFILMKIYRIGTVQSAAVAMATAFAVYAFFAYVADVSVPTGQWFSA